MIFKNALILAARCHWPAAIAWLLEHAEWDDEYGYLQAISWKSEKKDLRLCFSQEGISLGMWEPDASGINQHRFIIGYKGELLPWESIETYHIDLIASHIP